MRVTAQLFLTLLILCGAVIGLFFLAMLSFLVFSLMRQNRPDPTPPIEPTHRAASDWLTLYLLGKIRIREVIANVHRDELLKLCDFAQLNTAGLDKHELDIYMNRLNILKDRLRNHHSSQVTA